MPKKKAAETALIVPGSLPVGGTSDFSHIIQKDIPLAQKRSMILVELGLKKPKKQYATKEERKLAAKERTKERKKERLSVLEKYGLEPKKKGPKLSKEQKKQRRKTRSKAKRTFLRDMARADPEMAKKYGIDPARFKL